MRKYRAHLDGDIVARNQVLRRSLERHRAQIAVDPAYENRMMKNRRQPQATGGRARVNGG